MPLKSPEKIAEAINYILENNKEAEKIAKNGQKLIKEKFSAERAAKEYTIIYSRLK